MIALKVGQTLWYVSNQRYSSSHQGVEVTIIKIGRKWATLSDHYGRIDMETLWVDGGEYISPGRCYLSQASYLTMVSRDDAWLALNKAMEYRDCPDFVTEADIRAAAMLLGVPLP